MKKTLMFVLCLVLCLGVSAAHAASSTLTANVEGELYPFEGEEFHGDLSDIGGPMFAMPVDTERFHFNMVYQIEDRVGPMYRISMDEEGEGPLFCEIRFLPDTDIESMGNEIFAEYKTGLIPEGNDDIELALMNGKSFYAYDGDNLYNAALYELNDGVLAFYIFYETSEYAEGHGAYLAAMIDTFRFTD